MAGKWKWVVWGMGVCGLWFYCYVASPLLPAIQAYYSSKQGQCTILAGRIQYISEDIQTNPGSASPSLTIPLQSYVPVFTFVVATADGRLVQAHGYAPGTLYLAQGEAQAILKRYAVGGVYACLYNPAQPAEAWLTLEITTQEVALVIGALIVIVLINLGLTIVLLKDLRSRRRLRNQQVVQL